MFQSTRPRGVRRSKVSAIANTSVSIHAPARGATEDTDFELAGARFNPRARAGCDKSLGLTRILTDVSIHAPARGATLLFT